MATFREQQRLVEKMVQEQIGLNNQYLKALRENSFPVFRNELANKRRRINSIFQEWKTLKDDSHNDISDVELPKRVNGVDAIKILERVEKIYLHLEHVALNDAKSLSDSGKGNIRKARAELQRIRLSLYDITGGKP